MGYVYIRIIWCMLTHDLVRWHAPKVAMLLTFTSLRLGGRIRSPRMILCSAYSASQPVRTDRQTQGMGGWVDCKS